MSDADTPWRQKAQQLIGKLCEASYRQANTNKNGSRKKKHVPYSVPEAATRLIECLNTNDEARAKSLFLHDYETMKASGFIK